MTVNPPYTDTPSPKKGMLHVILGNAPQREKVNGGAAPYTEYLPKKGTPAAASRGLVEAVAGQNASNPKALVVLVRQADANEGPLGPAQQLSC